MIEIRSIQNFQQVIDLQAVEELDLGECAAIVLAEELKADRLLMDERAGRRVAKARNLTVLGTVGVLLLAKEQELNNIAFCRLG